MIECVAIGDSIAVGLAGVTRCAKVAEVGRTAKRQAAIVQQLQTGMAIISLGSNDPDSPTLQADLEKVRAKVDAPFVVWVVPYHPRAAAAVRAVARAFGDGLIELRSYPSRDRVHPQSYAEIAAAIPNWRQGR